MRLTPNLIDDFVSYYVSNGYKAYTVQKFEYEIKHFFDFLATHNITSVEEITIVHIEEYKLYLRSKPIPKTSRYYGKKQMLAPKTISEKIQIAKNFFEFVNVKYNIGLDAKRIKIPKAKSERMDYFTLDEIKAIMQHIDGSNDYPINKARLKLLVMMGFTTGMRLAELLQVTIPDILAGHTTIIGKGDKVREVHFTPTIKKLAIDYKEIRQQPLPRTGQIAQVLEAKEYAIISHNPHNFGSVCVKSTICRAMGQLNAILNGDKKLSAHTLRHSCATYLLEQGVNIMEIKELLGHESLRTTQGYLHVRNKKLQETHNEIFGSI